MQKKYIWIKYFVFVGLLFNLKAYSQDIKFKNSYFKSCILNKYPEIDYDKNGEINQLEADKVLKLSLMELGIENVEDLKYFKNLKYLSLTDNKIYDFKLSDFPFLEELYIAKNNLSKIEISNLTSLKTFACGVNKLTKVIINNCPNIETLNLMSNQLNEIDLKSLKKLKYLTLDSNKLFDIDISNNTELIQIIIHNNKLKILNTTNNLKLKMNGLYIDEDVKIYGTEEQLLMYKPVKILKQG